MATATATHVWQLHLLHLHRQLHPQQLPLPQIYATATPNQLLFSVATALHLFFASDPSAVLHICLTTICSRKADYCMVSGHMWSDFLSERLENPQENQLRKMSRHLLSFIQGLAYESSLYLLNGFCITDGPRLRRQMWNGSLHPTLPRTPTSMCTEMFYNVSLIITKIIYSYRPAYRVVLRM
jgi:hypothetical protein